MTNDHHTLITRTLIPVKKKKSSKSHTLIEIYTHKDTLACMHTYSRAHIIMSYTLSEMLSLTHTHTHTHTIIHACKYILVRCVYHAHTHTHTHTQ